MFSWFGNFAGDLWHGVQITLALLVLAGFFGFLLAIVVALMRLARNPLIAAPAQFFCSVLRGTPLLVQIYVLYYGVGTLFASYPAIRGSLLWPYLREGFWYVAFALILSVGAYVGEVLRGGAAGSWMLDNLGPKVLAKDDSAGFRIDLQLKDLKLANDAAFQKGVPLPGLALTTALYLEAKAHGEGTNGNQALFRTFDRLANQHT